MDPERSSSSMGRLIQLLYCDQHIGIQARRPESDVTTRVQHEIRDEKSSGKEQREGVEPREDPNGGEDVIHASYVHGSGETTSEAMMTCEPDGGDGDSSSEDDEFKGNHWPKKRGCPQKNRASKPTTSGRGDETDTRGERQNGSGRAVTNISAHTRASRR